ncbi:MAG TPA: HlyD family efflux transporter periplasmic adaptor subunit [Saprospiraceae bacterium]|nr:HlyD family efflux transporter periplasmic adaptor subunit [Saprospiraceae bacterium]HMY85659.1 HlyD family efflux transporter periplasmic adaptor subunit [Saprospiraceae bacterium]HMZ23754.1 HlyD family efflux transporter periplasmic adaptor subunit [Saprospiraceae bacterium]HNA77664.1 HlyD family efflux transporter periplasmic adaptor subunit [Saprospiraceae bacterium]HNB61598.1 HlyD family efflux transporter periplasmic adaptor subunit [Saprospiraceae bacterium]
MAKMIRKNTIAAGIMIACMIVGIVSCNKDKDNFDASGSFEAIETIVSAEANGRIERLEIEEGQELEAGRNIGFIDSTQLFLKKKQLEAQIVAILGRKPDIPVQLSALQEQLRTAERERVRTVGLVKGEAATAKQLDDLDAQIALLKKQIEAQKSTLSISSTGLSKEAMPLQWQIAQVNDQLTKCRIVNPVKGSVLAKYAEAKEVTAAGKPLYKIADLSEIILRTYITGDQLSRVKPGQKVKVLTDDGKGGYDTGEGTIIWINDKAEFTPKTIQTKNERANMVYATKIKVKNDGRYKIGMYGEVLFQ